MESHMPGIKSPRPGDIAYCRRCFQILKFADDLNLIILSDEEFVELDASLRASINRILEEIKTNQKP